MHISDNAFERVKCSIVNWVHFSPSLPIKMGKKLSRVCSSGSFCDVPNQNGKYGKRQIEE
jgi:hypothetical protein